jgi:hypothetical protein
MTNVCTCCASNPMQLLCHNMTAALVCQQPETRVAWGPWRLHICGLTVLNAFGAPDTSHCPWLAVQWHFMPAGLAAGLGSAPPCHPPPSLPAAVGGDSTPPPPHTHQPLAPCPCCLLLQAYLSTQTPCRGFCSSQLDCALLASSQLACRWVQPASGAAAGAYLEQARGQAGIHGQQDGDQGCIFAKQRPECQNCHGGLMGAARRRPVTLALAA